MAPKDSKDASHHRFFSLRGKKKEPRIKKGLGEALGAIGLRPDEDGKCASCNYCVLTEYVYVRTSYQDRARPFPPLSVPRARNSKGPSLILVLVLSSPTLPIHSRRPRGSHAPHHIIPALVRQFVD